MLEKDDIDELDGNNHQITSSKSPDNFKPSIEGLSEREVRILVQDQFTPVASRQSHHKNLPIIRNIQSGSGLPTTSSATTPECPTKLHDEAITSLATKVPIAPTVSLTTAEQLLKQTKVAAASGDIFMTGKDLKIRYRK